MIMINKIIRLVITYAPLNKGQTHFQRAKQNRLGALFRIISAPCSILEPFQQGQKHIQRFVQDFFLSGADFLPY